MIMKKIIFFKSVATSIILITLFSGGIAAQDFPEKPFPSRLVNDFAGMLTSREVAALEEKLVTFDDSTSTQIAIVTISDLHGYDKADYAQRLAEKWGIGQKGLNNGIIILIKPKTERSSGQVQIDQGYGLEGAIPDLVCSQIIDNEILPEFRNGNYYQGLDKATSTLMSLASGEFPADQYGKSKGSDPGNIITTIFFIIFLIILFMRSGGGSNQRHISRKGLPLWMLLSMMNSGGNKHDGSWGGFSGGGGFGGGGGGGGFGGFGGGSFGGGGAGGSW
jgi:uncharacterized protein